MVFCMKFLEYDYEILSLEEMWDDSVIVGNIHDNLEMLGINENTEM